MWLLIIASALSFWLTSFIFCVSRKSPFVYNGGPFEGKNVLLVVAHPDDESMFFSPTLLYLTTRGYNLHILCLSTGNADGKGDMRKHELLKACALLGVPTQQVKILDHPNLQDGFGNNWHHSLLAKLVKEEVASCGINVVITFDSYGVSGHCNHRDVHYGVRKFMLESSHGDIEAWELVSTNILRKYIGPVDIWTSILYASSNPARSIRWLTNEDPRKSYVSMSLHASQWVWFRKLFMAFSSYTYMNTLRRIHPMDPSCEPPLPETSKEL
ncbi:hypothetical protein MLD38_027318 [Melastoma candidum]|uniref:Uncharacterized protein n=1 Tax=Melastoma candidum TaxID=119954 RepID=A0ACB9P382_9MYRT|nr:hypothetical protein MLD38_027318 [Melastoma candidum]